MKFVVVVTGASSGLGCMTALAHPRHTVYVWMRDTAGRNASQVSEITASYAGELARWGIETTIVVPGAFTKGTNRFAHAEAPADEARVEEYAEGPTKDIPTIAMKGLAALEPEDADPQAVADTIAAVVDMPFGKRPFRVHIDPSSDGAELVNAIADRVRAELLWRIGLEDV